MRTKLCPYCDEEKHVSYFSKDNKCKDGLRSYCKKCNIKQAKVSKLKKQELYAANARAYYIKNKEARKAYQKEYNKKQRVKK